MLSFKSLLAASPLLENEAFLTRRNVYCAHSTDYYTYHDNFLQVVQIGLRGTGWAHGDIHWGREKVS